MTKSTVSLELCKGLSRLNKKSKMLFVDNMNHTTINQISEMYANLEYITENEEIPAKLKEKLICAMRKNEKECKYISNRQSNHITKKTNLRRR